MTKTAPGSASSGSGSGAPTSSDYSTCPEAAKSRKLEEEILETGEKGVEEGREVKAAENLVREAEKSLRESSENCAVEVELKSREKKMCANTPEELAEALEVEDTRGNEEYIGVYEAVCGEHVRTH